jgi:hypothetical protein
MSDEQLTIPGLTSQPAFSRPATLSGESLPHWAELRMPRSGLRPGTPVVQNSDGVHFAYLDLIRMRDPDGLDTTWTLTVKRCGWPKDCDVCFEIVQLSHMVASGPDVFVCLDCVVGQLYRYAPAYENSF